LAAKTSNDEKIYGDLANIIFTSKFSYLLFCNPTHKTQIGTTNTWGTINNKLSGPIIMMGHLKTLSSNQIAFITLFTAGAHVPALFTSHHELSNFVERKPFS
jgi:hypothetical protein